MIIRKAVSEDIKQISGFQVLLARETENIELHFSTVKKGVSAALNDSSKGQYYIAEIDGKIVGSLLTTYEWSDWRNGTILWIQSVYILPEFRKQGIYRNMYVHIKNIVQQDDDLFGIRLYADKLNINAQKVYKNLGMSSEHYITFEWMK